MNTVWGIEPSTGDTLLDSPKEIQNYFNLHPIACQILWNRGFKGLEQIEKWLSPKLSDLPDPFSIYEMDKAVYRVADAIISGQKIGVYGDYDVDGTCGASILHDFFRKVGITSVTVQPNRFKDGYGVHAHLVEKLAQDGVQVLLTVDCGITAKKAAEKARECGVDLVVLDHHKVGTGFPDQAYAVVDPQRDEDLSGLKNICGAALAFFFIVGLRGELRKRDYFKTEIKEPNLLAFLDLVAVATVADIMDVRGVNRILLYHGMKVLRDQPRPGLKAILECAGITKPTAMHCGFVIGPRINAAGRLEDAKASLELLTSTDYLQSLELAKKLEIINSERRATQDEVVELSGVACENQISDLILNQLKLETPAAEFGPWPRALVVAPSEGTKWHEGVIGIVASKLMEKYRRPVFVLTEKEDDPSLLKGSIRSLSKIDILAVISQPHIAQYLENYGGHAFAGGLTLKKENLANFIKELNLHLVKTTEPSFYERKMKYDAAVNLAQVDEKLLEDLEKLEPFGHRFSEPLLFLEGAVVDSFVVMKEKHLKLNLGSSKLQAVWFNAFSENKQTLELLTQGKSPEIFSTLTWNEWKGQKKLQLMVKQAHFEEGSA